MTYLGHTTWMALAELKSSYAYGNLMATILLAQSVIEQSLGSWLVFFGGNYRKLTFAALIDTARKQGHITVELANAFHQLRQMRNPYIHHTVGDEQGSYARRILETHLNPDELAIEDARFAVMAVVDYVRHQNPGWNPEAVQWSEGQSCI